MVSLELFVLKLIMSMPGLDVFRIRDEYMYLLALGFLCICAVIGLLIYYKPDNSIKITITRLIYHFLAMLTSVSITAITVIYPYRVNNAIEEDLTSLKCPSTKTVYRKDSSGTGTGSKSNTKSRSQQLQFPKHTQRLKSDSSGLYNSRKNRTNSGSKSTKTNTNMLPSSTNLTPKFSNKMSSRSSPKLSPQVTPHASPKLSPPLRSISCPSPINTITDFQLNGRNSSPDVLHGPTPSTPGQRSRDRPKSKSMIEVIGMGSTPITASSPTAPSPNTSRLPTPNSRDIDRNERGQLNTAYNRVTLEQVMSELVGIEAFLKHLVKELSAENLFFLSDVVQYKMSFVEDGLLDQIYGWIMALPNDIPKSHILLEKDHYVRGRMICNKYIRQNSEREINISWSARVDIVNAFDSKDLNQLPTVLEYSTRFDYAASEIRKLLTDSYRRFCLTPVCISEHYILQNITCTVYTIGLK